MKKNLRILSIETSCDETGLAITEYDQETHQYTVLADSLNSQIDIHREFGGVFPTVAKREHGRNLTSLLFTSLEKMPKVDGAARIDPTNINLSFLDREQELKEIIKTELENPDSIILTIPDIDYVAVTRGPGLEPALWVGVSFAKFLSQLWQKPLLPVNHMEGHISSVLLGHSDAIAFPTLALLISGGHTELVDMENWGTYSIIGKTRDDAVGEAYDKVARILSLAYPGGPLIAQRAQSLRDMYNDAHIKSLKEIHGIKLPRPMIHSHDLDLSFSGLKTAVLYLVRDFKKEKGFEVLPEEIVNVICHEFESSVSEVLLSKLKFALRESGKTYHNLIVAGGVIANTFLREKLHEWCIINDITFLKPEQALATDNAVMIGLAASVGVTHGYITALESGTDAFTAMAPDGDWSLNTI